MYSDLVQNTVESGKNKSLFCVQVVVEAEAADAVDIRAATTKVVVAAATTRVATAVVTDMVVVGIMIIG